MVVEVEEKMKRFQLYVKGKNKGHWVGVKGFKTLRGATDSFYSQWYKEWRLFIENEVVGKVTDRQDNSVSILG
jgi:hypothetical protein